MEEIINYLQEIQEDLIGIIIPLIITAFVSVFSIFFNALAKLMVTIKQYISDQHTLKKKIYPRLKDKIVHIDYRLSALKRNDLYDNMMTSLSRYIRTCSHRRFKSK